MHDAKYCILSRASYDPTHIDFSFLCIWIVSIIIIIIRIFSNKFIAFYSLIHCPLLYTLYAVFYTVHVNLKLHGFFWSSIVAFHRDLSGV